MGRIFRNQVEYHFRMALSFCFAKLPFFEKRIGAEKELGGQAPLNLTKKKQYCSKCFNFPSELQTKQKAKTRWLLF